MTGSVVCDVVVPVFNALALSRRCLQSLVADTEQPATRIWIIDDHSDAVAAHWLSTFADAHAHIHYLRNRENLGFVRSANVGMALGQAPFVCVLNSDTVLPTGWLKRLVAHAAADARIGSVNPLTNRASHLDLSIPSGANFREVDRELRALALGAADVVTGVGFCLLLRRSALEEVGPFDEAYGRGYCEDSDLCMRLTTRGWRTVVARNVYVWHRGSGSFADRATRYAVNRRIFDQRWGGAYRTQFRRFRRSNPLCDVRRHFARPGSIDWTAAAWRIARPLFDAVQKRALVAIARVVRSAPSEVAAARVPQVDASLLARLETAGRLRVTYLVPKLVIAGGVRSVLQLANLMVLQGVTARVATLFEDPVLEKWQPLYLRPMVYPNFDALCSHLPECDLVVATHWSTADWARRCVREGRAAKAVYFVQDYEPWFVADNPPVRHAVEQTYAALRTRVVKSEWLRQLLRPFGGDTSLIRVGLDLDTFYPREVGKRTDTVMAMARPGTAYRGFDTLLQVCQRVHLSRPGIRFVFFGDRGLRADSLPFPAVNMGVMTNADQLAALYSEATVFLDTSRFQAVGRCALEAMACGTPCVVTNAGGVAEYLEDGVTALASRPDDVEKLSADVVRLLDDGTLRSLVAGNAHRRVRQLGQDREATETIALFERIVAGHHL